MKNNLSFCFFDGAKVGWFSSLTNRFLLFFSIPLSIFSI